MAERSYKDGRDTSTRLSATTTTNGGAGGSLTRLTSSSGQMQNLLQEFRGLYEGRLRRLDESGKTGEDTQKVM